MNILIVYGHPNPKSFNHAILERAKEIYEAKGDKVVIRDLYAMGFDPILKGEDFISFAKGQTPKDIATEQEHIKKADKIVFIFPIWWANMPAMLKGYVDRVIAHGFAYKYEADGSATPLLADKKGIIINTTGGNEESYTNFLAKGIDISIDKTVFGFCGIDVQKHLYFYNIPRSTEEERKAILENLKNQL